MQRTCQTLTVIFTLATLVTFAASAHGAGGSIGVRKPYPEFHVGVTGIKATVTKGEVTVSGTYKDTPADGRFEKGDVLLSVNGTPLKTPDPRVQLGNAITAAEATRAAKGRIRFSVRRGRSTREITITIPALGRYSRTWPVDCEKSKKIVEQTAEYVVRSGLTEKAGIGNMLAGIFLLSTDDPRYLPIVKRQVYAIAAKPTVGGGSCWPRGYQGILMAEYYLKTGDRAVLGGLKRLCDGVVGSQLAGGWAHGGLAKDISGGYVQSALMNPAGVPILTALALARECGVEVDEECFERALRLFYRMAGHGNVCYGDHRSELMWPGTNGKNGMLACALSLLDEKCYRMGAAHMSLLIADCYYKPEFGHTGGGFNVIWRGMGSVHVPADRKHHYRRQMDWLSWYYDLARLPGGGFSMPPCPPDTRRYCGETWGTGGIGLTYTAPLKTLRITGAPRTRFSVRRPALARVWGTPRDVEFLRTDYLEGYGTDEPTPEEIHDRLLGEKSKGEVPVEYCAKMLRHYSPMVRIWASRKLGDSEAAVAEIARMLDHDDPRMRRSGLDCISLYDNWRRSSKSSLPASVVSKRLVPGIERILNDPAASWWEIDGALYAMGRAEPADIRRNMATVKRFLRHEEWFIRESAFWTVVGLHAAITPEEFQILADAYALETQVFARSSMDGGFRQLVRTDRVELDRDALARSIGTLGHSLHSATLAQGMGEPGIHEVTHRTMMILKHFDPSIYEFVIDDFEKYLAIWKPYFQHSAWLIMGSKWQPGLLKVLELQGAGGRRLCAMLKAVLEDYSKLDRKRIPKWAADLDEKMRAAIEAWEKKHGEVKPVKPEFGSKTMPWDRRGG